jgi:hypothetical protein
MTTRTAERHAVRLFLRLFGPGATEVPCEPTAPVETVPRRRRTTGTMPKSHPADTTRRR